MNKFILEESFKNELREYLLNSSIPSRDAQYLVAKIDKLPLDTSSLENKTPSIN